VGEAIRLGLEAYKKDVETGAFPSMDYCPYKVN
jgi:hypothetical protein